MHKKNKSHRAILFYSLFCFAVFAVDFAWGETGAAVQPDTKAELKKSVENAILNKVIENVDDAATDVKKKIINDAEKLEVQSQQQGKPVDPESLTKATNEALQTVDEVVGDLKEQQEIHGTDEKESVLAPVERVPAEPTPDPFAGVLMKLIGAVVAGVILFVLLLWWLRSSEARSLSTKSETRPDHDQT